MTPEKILVDYPLICSKCYRQINKKDKWELRATQGGLLLSRHVKNCKRRELMKVLEKRKKKKKLTKAVVLEKAQDDVSEIQTLNGSEYNPKKKWWEFWK